MSAGQVAGLLVLLGVAGVLAAIVGKGIEAGPVKFPSIPVSRQKLLAVASAVVIVGGIAWWALQQQSGNKAQTASSQAQAGPAASGKLRISLIPAHSNIRVGQVLTVSAEVYNSLGQQLGTGECELKWTDTLSGWQATTPCAAKVSEPPVSTAGVHRIVAEAEGRSGVRATGKQSVEVTVRR
jgi:hypothetical protein